MSVRRRANSRFYQYRFMVDGVPYSGSTKQTDPNKARAFEAALSTKIREGGRIVARKCPTLKEFSADFLKYVDASQELARKTRLSYRNGWRLLKATPVAAMRLNAIGTKDAAVLTFPGSGSNANQALRTLRRMLSYACELDLLKAAPKINLRDEKQRKTVLEGWVEDLLLECAPPALRTVAVLMLDSGMRPDEAKRLRWEHIDAQNKAIAIHEGKTDAAARFVGLTERMASTLRLTQALNQRKAKRARRMESPWVFPSRSESGHMENFSQTWARTIKRMKVVAGKRGLPQLPEGMVLYSCRHTFATRFLKASGNDQAALKEIMGHSTMRITERYVHPGIANAAAIMDEFNAQRHKLALVRGA